MDKNTITGLLLIAAIMFGFFYFTKSDAKNPQTTPAETTAPASTASAPGVEPLGAADTTALLTALHATGIPGSDNTFTYTSEDLNLSDANGRLEGTVAAADTIVPVDAFLAGDVALTPVQKARATATLRTFIDNAHRYEGLSRYLGGNESEYVLENDSLAVTLTTRGARVAQVRLKTFRTEIGDSSDVLLMRDATDGYGFSFFTAEQRIDTRDFNFEAVAEGDSAVVMTIHPTAGATWGIRYALSPDNYLLRMEVFQQGMDAVLPPSTSHMELNWHQKMARNEVGRTFEERNSAIYYKYVGESPDDLSASGNDSENLNGRLRWVAFKNQFFSSVLIARDAISSATVTSSALDKNPLFLKDMTMSAVVPYSGADGTAAAFDWYFGPNSYPLLSSLDGTLGIDEDLDLTRLIPLGWGIFRWINTLIVIPVFTFLGHYIANYGIIILLLTIFIKIIIFPFTFKSYRSQARMKVLAPEIKAINEKYPGQDQAMQRSQETMALYSRAGASPFSGCLPMLLQMPVLIAMFSFFPSAIELRGQSFLWAHDLSAPDSILTLPFSIPFYGNHVSLFCLLMTAVNIIYIRISMSSQPSTGMPGMKLMQYLMPVMFLFIFNDYASGLTYYYFISLLITIIQTWIFRHFTNDDKIRAEMAANAAKPRKKKGFMARLEAASRQAQAAQRAQQQAADRRRRR